MNGKKEQRKVLTTGAVARLLDVNINTVIKWFDDGEIQGFRLPGSNDRRIPVDSLRDFMRRYAMPLDLLEENRGPQRRTSERVSIEDPVRFTVIDGEIFGPYLGRLKNLSAGGACLRAAGDEAVALPTHAFSIDFNIEDGPLAETRLAGKVVHVQPVDEQLAFGLQFMALDDEGRERLLRFLESRMN
ncbi:MAG: helix-turn-helix domain-containing protein [Myxococcales bacterium]|nr:MAG: helix-turn-helix domain-containing protein [Myxococcales bacterium]